MTKQQFINSVLAEPNVIGLLPNTDKVMETFGDYEKGQFQVLITEPQGGQNFRQVWYIRNTLTDETGYQTLNTINVVKNTYDAVNDRLVKYLKANFTAHFIVQSDLENSWAVADTYTVGVNAVYTKVLVYKSAGSPFTHKVITTI